MIYLPTKKKNPSFTEQLSKLSPFLREKRGRKTKGKPEHKFELERQSN